MVLSVKLRRLSPAGFLGYIMFMVTLLWYGSVQGYRMHAHCSNGCSESNLKCITTLFIKVRAKNTVTRLLNVCKWISVGTPAVDFRLGMTQHTSYL